MRFEFYCAISNPVGPLESLRCLADWCSAIGPDFELYEYKSPGDVQFESDGSISRNTAEMLLENCKIHGNSYYFPIGCKKVAAKKSVYPISTVCNWSPPENGQGRTSLTIRIQQDGILDQLLVNDGIVGLCDLLNWPLTRCSVKYAWASRYCAGDYEGYKIKDGNKTGWMSRIPIEDALDRVQWITYYSNEVIDTYSRDLLMNASWHKIIEREKGCFFVVTKDVLDWKNPEHCAVLTKILNEIQFHKRFYEQSVDYGKKEDKGTIVFHPETGQSFFEPPGMNN